ncbi:fungal specific transcription factor [Seiridium cupressi]
MKLTFYPAASSRLHTSKAMSRHKQGNVKSSATIKPVTNAASQESRHVVVYFAVPHLRSCHVVSANSQADSVMALAQYGETRIEATKNRSELLEKVISTLQSSSPEQAAELLDGIRSSEDLSLLLDRVTVPKQATSPAQSSPSATTQCSSGSPTPLPDVNDLVLTPNDTAPPSASGSEDQASVTSPSKQPHSCSRAASAEDGSGSLLMLSGAHRVKLPNAKDVAQAIHKFFQCSGRLFHVVQDEGLDPIKVCVLLAVYNIMHKATVALAYVANHHAIKEVGISLSRQLQMAPEGRKHPLPPASAFTERKHTWRTLTFLSNWLSSTLGYVSGNEMVPDENIHLEVSSNNSDIAEIVQAEMTNVAVLKSKILRMHLAFKDLTVLSVKAILLDLQTWYGRMPPQIRLDYKGHDSLEPLTKWSMYHVHLLYLGANILLYRRMSSQLVEVNYHNDRGVLPTPLDKLYSDHGEQAILAAKGTARILTLMLHDGGIFRRCWLVIFQAFTSCLIILHSAMQKVLHNWPVISWQDDLQKAELCLAVLKYCAAADPTAHRFHAELRDVYDYVKAQNKTASFNPRGNIRRPLVNDYTGFEERPKTIFGVDTNASRRDSSYLITIPTSANPEHVERSCLLLTKLCQPFGDPNHHQIGIDDIKQRWREEPPRGLATLLLAQLDWDLESRQPFVWNVNKMIGSGGPPDSAPQNITDGRMPSILELNLGHLGGRFLGSAGPSGWTTWEDEKGGSGTSNRGIQVTVDEMIID